MNKKRIKKTIAKIFSPWGLVPLLMAVICNFVVYIGCNVLTRNWDLHSLALPLDYEIPLVPWTIVIYFGCYLFWIVNYILIYRRNREYAYRFFIADFLSRIVCLAFFVLYPTTLARPEVEGSGIFDAAMRFLYKVDAPTNLFPSIHCLVSWFCFIGIAKDKTIHLWYRIFSFFFAVAVFISTLTTRQHVILDVVGGVALAQICYWISQKTSHWKAFEKTFDHLNGFFAE